MRADRLTGEVLRAMSRARGPFWEGQARQMLAWAADLIDAADKMALTQGEATAPSPSSPESAGSHSPKDCDCPPRLHWSNCTAGVAQEAGDWGGDTPAHVYVKPPSFPTDTQTTAQEAGAPGGYAEFADYVARNYHAGTVISDPLWHAPRLYRAALRASAPIQEAGAREPVAPAPVEVADMVRELNDLANRSLAPKRVREAAALIERLAAEKAEAERLMVEGMKRYGDAMARAEAAERDAERYLWLRDLPSGSPHECVGNMPGDWWDEEIDTRMRLDDAARAPKE
jgi:hypothetical protein